VALKSLLESVGKIAKLPRAAGDTMHRIAQCSTKELGRTPDPSDWSFRLVTDGADQARGTLAE